MDVATENGKQEVTVVAAVAGRAMLEFRAGRGAGPDGGGAGLHTRLRTRPGRAAPIATTAEANVVLTTGLWITQEDRPEEKDSQHKRDDVMAASTAPRVLVRCGGGGKTKSCVWPLC